MNVTTKNGDLGYSTLPTEVIGRIPKCDLAFDVLGKIDELDHDFQAIILRIKNSDRSFFRNLSSKVEKVLVEGVRYLYSCLLSTDRSVDIQPKIDELISYLEETAVDFEKKYRYFTGQDMKSDFGKIYSSQRGLLFNKARVQCRHVERALVNHMVEEDNSHLLSNRKVVLPFVNRLSDWLYEAALVSDLLECLTEDPDHIGVDE